MSFNLLKLICFNNHIRLMDTVLDRADLQHLLSLFRYRDLYHSEGKTDSLAKAALQALSSLTFYDDLEYNVYQDYQCTSQNLRSKAKA